MSKIHNFSAGPSILAESAFEKSIQDIKNFAGTGLSILEVSHRGKEFEKVMADTVTLVRELLNVPENYGVPIGQSVRTEWLAFSLLADWNKQLSENINLKVRYQMYANYETLTFDAIDHRLDFVLAAKVSNAISVTMTALAIYDLDQDEKVQFSQGLGIGLVYKM